MNPEITARLLALPSLQKQAEEDARETVNKQSVVDPSFVTWEQLATMPGFCGPTVMAQATLLADLTRWQSQAWALREIAKLAGFKTVSDSVPAIQVIPDEKRPVLIVECGLEAMCFCLEEITSRPAAIAAILLHLSESK